MPGQIYLIPTPLGDNMHHTIPAYIQPILNELTHFVVEKEKTARRFLKKMGYVHSLDTLQLYPLNKRTTEEEVLEYLQVLLEGHSIGIISEAGNPCIADPGALLVEMAHQNNIKVQPLVGPSSILLALIASGLNGQNFAFHGYLSHDKNERKRAIQQLERTSAQTGQTQIFMETPYRNNQIIDEVLATCRDATRFCIACDLTLPSEWVKTQPITQWRKKKPGIHKRPAIFLLSSGLH